MERLSIDLAAYGQLLAERVPRKINTSEEYDRLADEAEKIAFNENASPEEGAYGELLVELLLSYDRAHPFLPKATPLSILKNFMEEHRMTQPQFAKLVGSRAYASQILTGKRAISRGIAKKLAGCFNVKAEAFLD